MPMHTIHPDALREALKGRTREQYKQSPQLRAWCAALETGSVIYFPTTPVPLPVEDVEVLLGQQQTGSRLHKNISYKPDTDLLGGVDRKSTPAAEVDQLHGIMRRYSSAVADFLSRFL